MILCKQLINSRWASWMKWTKKKTRSYIIFFGLPCEFKPVWTKWRRKCWFYEEENHINTMRHYGNTLWHIQYIVHTIGIFLLLFLLCIFFVVYRVCWCLPVPFCCGSFFSSFVYIFHVFFLRRFFISTKYLWPNENETCARYQLIVKCCN